MCYDVADLDVIAAEPNDAARDPAHADEFGNRCDERSVALVELDEVLARRRRDGPLPRGPDSLRPGLFDLQLGETSERKRQICRSRCNCYAVL